MPHDPDDNELEIQVARYGETWAATMGTLSALDAQLAGHVYAFVRRCEDDVEVFRKTMRAAQAEEIEE